MGKNSWVGIIDGDIVIYRLCYTIEPEAELAIVKFRVDKYMHELLTKVGCGKYIGILGIHGSNNPKYALFPDYKRGRPVDKPPHWNQVMNYLISRWQFTCVSGCETDDAIALCMSYIGDNGIVVSSDKDLLQISGDHFIMGVTRKGKIVREDKKTYITKERALYNYYSQMLTGDIVDNIKGITGIGPKKAEKLLAGKNEIEMFDIVKGEYQREYGEDWGYKYNFTFKLINITKVNAVIEGFICPEPIEYIPDEIIGY